MKTITTIMVSLLVSTLTFTACGFNDGSDSASRPLEALIENPSIFIPENTTESTDVSVYIANASSFTFVDNDSDSETTVSADGKSFISASLNITLSDNIITIVAGGVDVSTVYNFGIVGVSTASYFGMVGIVGADDSTNSLEVNATVEVVDAQDDQAVVLSDVVASSKVTSGEDVSISLVATDPDGMETVTVEVKDSNDAILHTVVAYADGNISRAINTTITVNETFSNLEVGSYSFVITAKGLVGGEGERSSISEDYEFVMEEETVVEPTPIPIPTPAEVCESNGGFWIDGDEYCEYG